MESFEVSQTCVLYKFDWLVALYLFILLVRNASVLILKSSGDREELSDVNKRPYKNIMLVSLRLCMSPLVLAPPQLTFSLNLPPLQRHRHVLVENFASLQICH